MAEPGNLHRNATRAMSLLMVLLGTTMIVATVAGGGGVLAKGLLLGVLFVAAGGLRLHLSRGER